MERTPAAEEAGLARAAGALGAQVDGAVSRWLERVGSAIYAPHPELDRRNLADRAAELVHGVAEALRQGQHLLLQPPGAGTGGTPGTEGTERA